MKRPQGRRAITTRIVAVLLLLQVSVASCFVIVKTITPSISSPTDRVLGVTTHSSLSSTSQRWWRGSLLLMSQDDIVEDTTNLIWTQEELETFASEQGVLVSLNTLGPGFRCLARAKHNSSQILGYVEGFVRPTGSLLHLDKMEVFKPMLKKARVENPAEFKGGGTILGVGLLMGYVCLLHGRQAAGCVDAEFLAIDDEEYQHKRLVRYYQAGKFDVIKYVGDDFRDIPDRMVWGGCGTLLRKDIETLLVFWTSLMRRSQAKYKKDV